VNVAKKGAMHEKEKGRENMRQRRARECARDRKRQREREREREKRRRRRRRRKSTISLLSQPAGRPRLPRLVFPCLMKHRRQDSRRQLEYGPLDSVAPSSSVLLFFRLVLRG